MEELRGDRTTWVFDGESVRCRPGRSRDPVLRALGGWRLPVAAIAGVDLTTRQRRGRWVLRLRPHERVDPYAAVGARLATPAVSSTLLELAGPAKRELLAEYWADLVGDAAARSGPAPADAARGLVPPVPLHIRTAEGTAAFDGTRVVLVWSGSQATSRKRREQRREYPLATVREVEWVPSDGWQWGHLRVITSDTPAGPAGRPKHDPYCLLFNKGREGHDALLLAATVTAHLWSRDGSNRAVGPSPGPPALAGPTPDSPTPDSATPDGPAPERTGGATVHELVRQLGRLHAEGVLTDEEYATKKAALLNRR